MGDVSAELSGTFRAGTAKECTIFIFFRGSTADRALRRQLIRYRIIGTLSEIYFQNFRDDFTCFADQNRITDPDITLGDKILIMKGCIGNCRSGKTDSLNNGFWGKNAGSANLNNDIPPK